MKRFRHLGIGLAMLLGASGSAHAISTLLVSNGQLATPATDLVIAYDATSGSVLGDFVTPGNGLDGPRGITYGPDGNLYVANNGGNNVLKYDGKTGVFLGTFVAAGSGGLAGPEDVVFHGSDLYVSGFSSGNVLKYNASTGAFDGIAATETSGADGINFDSAGNLYVCSSQAVGVSGTLGNEVDKFDSTGTLIGTFATGFGNHGPRDITFDASGNAYVTTGEAPDAAATVALDAVEKYASDGTDLGAFVTSGLGGLSLPRHLEFGPNGDLFVASQNSSSVVEFSGTDGSLVGVFASGGGLNRTTYFTFHDVTTIGPPPPPPSGVPLPAGAWMSLSTLAGLGLIAARRAKISKLPAIV